MKKSILISIVLFLFVSLYSNAISGDYIWKKVNYSGRLSDNGILTNSDNDIYINTDKQLLISDDDGDTFDTVYSVTEGNSIYDVCINHNDDVFLFDSQVLMKSTNKGKDWAAVYEGAEEIYSGKLQVGPDNTLYSAATKALWRSTDHGAKWDKIDLPSAAIPIQLGINQYSGDLILTRLWQHWKSDDKGESWSSTGSHHDWSGVKLRVYNSDIFFLSDDGGYGLMKTTDGGDSWYSVLDIADDFYACEIYGRNMFFSADDKLYYSTDIGESWQEVNNFTEDEGLVVKSICINDNYLFISHDYYDNLHIKTDVYKFALEDIPLSVEKNNETTAIESIVYPNPVEDIARLKYKIPESGHAVLTVRDILGNEIETLVSEYLAAGNYETDFDASMLAPGAYSYTISINGYVLTKIFVKR